MSLYALLRHLLLGPAWGWYFIGGFAAGLGVFTKGVGFLPMLLLIPYFLLRALRWQGLAVVDGGHGRLALVARAARDVASAISLWFVPMLLAVATSGRAEYAAYRDEILFKQTVGRYAAAWHHVKAWYYFLVEVIPRAVAAVEPAAVLAGAAIQGALPASATRACGCRSSGC